MQIFCLAFSVYKTFAQLLVRRCLSVFVLLLSVFCLCCDLGVIYVFCTRRMFVCDKQFGLFGLSGKASEIWGGWWEVGKVCYNKRRSTVSRGKKCGKG